MFWGILGIFGQTISAHFDTVSPLSMFQIIQPLLLQEIGLYIYTADIVLGFKFEFGLQSIKDLAFVCL
jgi:hypothetical protein